MTTPGTMKKLLSAWPAKLRNLGQLPILHERKGSMYSVLIFPLPRGSDDIAADGSHCRSGPWHLTNIATFPDVCFAPKSDLPSSMLLTPCRSGRLSVRAP
jgi:hypothetical protein